MKGKTSATLLIFMFFAMACGNNNNNVKTGEEEKKDTTSKTDNSKTIVFFGNSLTAGYGLTPAEAFPALIQQKIDSLDLNYKVVNAGVSGETSSGGNSRIDWILREKPDLFVLELGANDGLRGIPLEETKKNLQAILDKVKLKNTIVKIMIAGMQIPPNMGQKYTSQFREIFPLLAKENNATLIPFLLGGVGGEVKLNQQDGIHPTAEGHKIVAENVWKEMEKLL